MRKVLLSSLFVIAGIAGCSTRSSTPSPAPDLPPHASAVAPATVVYTGRTGTYRTVGAAIEDGSRTPVALSRAGVDTVFAGVLPEQRALLAEMAADGSIAALAAVRADGAERSAMGAFGAGQYRAVAQLKAAGDDVVVELTRVDTGASDLFALRAGAAPRPLASNATLTAVALGRAAFVSGGDLRSVKLDGTAPVSLGAGDGRDLVAQVRADRILLTLHAGATGDVRLVGIDGGGKIDLGDPALDETAVALTGSQRIVYLRRTAAGAVMVSSSLEGKDERVLTAPALDAKPIQVTAEGQILFGDLDGALLAVSASGGGAPRVLDAEAGTNVRVGSVLGGQVFYTSDSPHWPSLRVAQLDGTGVASLCEITPWVPFFSGLMADGRVVFYRALAGQLEGGAVFSVKLDGSDLRQIGTAVTDMSGKALASGPDDQDFEAITPSGRLILEAEFETTGGGSHLVVGSADSESARMLTEPTHVRFAALIP